MQQGQEINEVLQRIIASKNHYEVLGLERDASSVEIRKSYLNLSRRVHPDKCENRELATEAQKKVNEAYQILSDPSSKRTFDESLGAIPKPRATEAPEPSKAEKTAEAAAAPADTEDDREAFMAKCENFSATIFGLFTSCSKFFHTDDDKPDKGPKRK
jgi:curved DNA-binding protein CbpA